MEIAMTRNYRTTHWAQSSIAAFGLVLLATTAATAADNIISDSGTVEAATNYAARSIVSLGYAGTGPVSGPSYETAAEYARLSTYKGISLGGPESVIGPDGRTRVTSTTTSPYRKIALITFSDGPDGYMCTGWFVNKNTIVTAGHCVHKGSGGSTGFYARSTYKIFPGRNGSTLNFPTCTAKGLWTNTSWTNGGGSTVDYGAIKLNCTVGTQTGWFGYFWQSASLVGKPATVTGYPGDKTFATMWKMSGSIGRNTTKTVSYAIDTAGGQSGSPVYYNKSGCGWCSMAIHTYAASGSPPMNSGTRITQGVYNFIGTIKAKP
jgi:glutamyl endopeptidase